MASEERGPRGPGILTAVILLVTAVLVAHRGHARAFLNYDDDDYVVNNPIVVEGLGAEGVRSAFTEAHAANWHPLTWCSHMLDVELFELDAAAHQRTSILLHLVAAMVLFRALLALTGKAAPSLLVAGLFALHPQHVESVHWISERKDVLAGLFFALTLLLWARHVRAPSRARYALAALALGAGLLSKATVVTLPFVLLLLDLWPLRRWPERSARALVVEKLPLFLLAGGVALVAAATQSGFGTTTTLTELPLADRLGNAVVSAGAYALKAAWPVDLAVFYPHPAVVSDGGPFGATFLLALAALVAALLLAWRARGRRPWLTVGLLWYLGCLLPVIGLVQIGEQARADRYTYLPMIGLYLAAVFGAWEAWPRARRAVLAVGCLALLLCARATLAQAATWRDSRTLFEHALAVTDRNYVALSQLAHVDLSEGRPEDARRRLELALAIHSDARMFTNLAAALNRLGEHAEAEARARRAVRLDETQAEAHNNLGIALGGQGRARAAAESFRRATELRPTYVEAWFNLGKVEAARGELDAARAAYRRVLELAPGDAEAARFLAEN
jgi:Tfp pilus assembly protein PilF